MARDDPKKPRLDIRNDHHPIHREHHSPRGNAPLNLDSFTRRSQRLDPQKLMWLQGTKLPLYVWLGVFAIAYSRSRSPYRPCPAWSRGSPCVKRPVFADMVARSGQSNVKRFRRPRSGNRHTFFVPNQR